MTKSISGVNSAAQDSWTYVKNREAVKAIPCHSFERAFGRSSSPKWRTANRHCVRQKGLSITKMRDKDANVRSLSRDQRDAVKKVAGILRPNATKSEANSQYVNLDFW